MYHYCQGLSRTGYAIIIDVLTYILLESTRHELSRIVYLNYPTHICKFEAIDSLHNLQIETCFLDESIAAVGFI